MLFRSLGSSSPSIQSMTSLAEQFQKFLTSQPHAMSTLSSGMTSGMSSGVWVLDSGASNHMSPDSSSFVSLCSASSLLVLIADGTPMPLTNIGSVVIPYLSLSLVFTIFPFCL